ncbi:DinB family protein [Cyclobacterium jeungdonense]|uniref:DinB family protein n=1 Tax=Cyclobacterium jeungdonense TaxID=708087 RepID=A0ABT8C8A2_9BACT|nr:DinB family protein [Cyclobacterium jeungdonense]MDN3688387.1 DinB family protein [Cyclobacterium jeungdonense]
MKAFFEELFAYGHDSNQRLWEAMMANREKIPEKSIKLYNHILNAQQIWNNRIDPRMPLFGVWDERPISDEKGINQSNHEHTLTILDNYPMDTIITYGNSKGKVYTNAVGDILFHLVNHSTYHRGQIATDFRQNGLEPLVSDYILYKR